jgi:cation transport ATPase
MAPRTRSRHGSSQPATRQHWQCAGAGCGACSAQRPRQVSTHDVVVGDVVLLSTGDMVCADGIVFRDNDLGLSEQMLTGESVVKRKGAYCLGGGDNPDAAVKVQPTLFAGTLVQEGEGTRVVVAVGGNTYQVETRGRTRWRASGAVLEAPGADRRRGSDGRGRWKLR